ncbi:sigma-70 family RNA polymerase sigma factor [Rhodoplanes sp. TEM]|uniref:RNA polymerase sigma factor n=1 Tax=Rhodoplanes tepidamans TaxID=200616 RepID=A0ABT5JFY4_RHOTP|nr:MULTISPECIES: sigma-70 family RNA polymerase sigma factor [Rhodoplanes]MDC7788596.1 sigma-70 family RNA polymerase sigma factor [Rhodoplanes tepidamans]MDC7986852.1 sigma-70 family RNA polymerase sigma factor [Rhodoplanes sp. TEM]MDQ0358579.1 RNA polymerase sigma-70 factor (ECF subfamily) [Rhodoplanes tepidamans]
MAIVEGAKGSVRDHDRLIEAIAARADREAFAALFAHFAPRVKAFLMRSGTAADLAEELAQETLVTVWRKAALFDASKAGASAWIFAIARNLRIDAARRQRREMLHAMAEEPEPELAPPPDHDMEAGERQKRVRAALDHLPGEQRRIVELSFFEGRAHGDIAGLLDIPLGTVKSRLRLAMNRMRSLLGDLT